MCSRQSIRVFGCQGLGKSYSSAFANLRMLGLVAGKNYEIDVASTWHLWGYPS
jgi:hypothetical protein